MGHRFGKAALTKSTDWATRRWGAGPNSHPGQPSGFRQTDLDWWGNPEVKYFAQGLGVAELAKEHGHELAPTAETPGVSLGAAFPHGGFKLQT
jgi:hypothetical protein